jgi:serine/threonine-protein kinase
MLGKNPQTDTVVIRALGKLGDHAIVDKLVPMLKRPEREVQVEAIKAIAHLADEKRAETIRNVLMKIKQSEDPTIINNADKAIKELDAKFSATVLEENVRAEKMQEHTRTLLIENEDLDELLSAKEDQILDISKLQPGDVIDGRYKFVEKIGKGAFGTVLLMQDQVVDEHLILKFLNPNVSSDEEMMKRFVH